MSRLSPAVLEFLASGPLAHVVTLGPAGDPHVSLAWVGVEDDELVIGTLRDQRKLQNLRNDPRIALSFEVGGQIHYRAPQLSRAARARSRHRGRRSGAPATPGGDLHRPGRHVSRRCQTHRPDTSPGSPSRRCPGWATGTSPPGSDVRRQVAPARPHPRSDRDGADARVGRQVGDRARERRDGAGRRSRSRGRTRSRAGSARRGNRRTARRRRVDRRRSCRSGPRWPGSQRTAGAVESP